MRIQQVTLIIVVAACSHPATKQSGSRAPLEKETAAPRCYAMRWTDTAWPGMIPDSVLLGSGPDSALVPGVAGPFPLKPVADPARRPLQWRDLTNAAWFSRGRDSLIFRFMTAHASWSAYFGVRGDSLHGAMFFSGLDGDGSTPSAASGIRFDCPSTRTRAGA